MSATSLIDQPPTGASIGRGATIESPTRTISQLVNDSSRLRDETMVLAADTSDLAPAGRPAPL